MDGYCFGADHYILYFSFLKIITYYIIYVEFVCIKTIKFMFKIICFGGIHVQLKLYLNRVIKICIIWYTK